MAAQRSTGADVQPLPLLKDIPEVLRPLAFGKSVGSQCFSSLIVGAELLNSKFRPPTLKWLKKMPGLNVWNVIGVFRLPRDRVSGFRDLSLQRKRVALLGRPDDIAYLELEAAKRSVQMQKLKLTR